jgi:hypothetical protein
MWVNKDDIFADDKIQEFKDSNPKSEMHIRSTSSAKSPHSSASTRPHLLYQHTLCHMSSDGNNELTFEYPAGAVADSLSHFPKQTLTLPLFLSQQSPSLTLPPYNHSAPLLPSLVLNLSPLPPQPQMSLPCSGSPESTCLPHSLQMGSVWQTELLKCLVFCSPLPEGEAMKQAQSWHQAQLLDLWQLWELR